MNGIVKFFDAKKGYGFITGDDGQEYFVHFSAIKSDGFKTLNEGDKVEFSLTTDDRGTKAVDVKVITE